MIRFSVFDETGPAKRWPLINAYLFGPDDQAMTGSIQFENGEIVCRKRGSKAAGLALQYDAGSAGQLVLQTCLLPESDTPYVLSHELARHRIKTFLVKCEEWQLFELSADHSAMQHWESARQLFTLGLNEKDPVKMDRYGRESLEKAIESTEKLAMAHAEVLLHRRYGHRAASSSTLGVRIDPSLSPEAHGELLSREFDLLYVPLRWRDLEPREGEYDWEPVDRWMKWAQKHKRPVVAGPLVDFSARSIPDWMYVWQHDYETTRDLTYDHIERVVQRYQQIVAIWSIGAGVNVNDNFHFTDTQMLDLTRMANLMIRQGRRGRTMLEIVHPFGEFVARNRDALSPLTFIDRVVQEGIRVHCYGVQFAFDGKGRGIRARDLMQLSDALDRYFMLELPVLVTNIGVPSKTDDGDTGYWHEPWTPRIQEQWLARAFPLVMSKPHVESFFWTQLQDAGGEDATSSSGLFTVDGVPRPALKRLTDMRRRLRKPLGPLRLTARGVRAGGGTP